MTSDGISNKLEHSQCETFLNRILLVTKVTDSHPSLTLLLFFSTQAYCTLLACPEKRNAKETSQIMAIIMQVLRSMGITTDSPLHENIHP